MNLKELIKFRVSQNTKIILTGSSVMISMTLCMVIIARAMTVDNVWTNADEWTELSAKIVADIRKAMNNTSILSAPLQAYIIPSFDAHQNKYVSNRDDRVGYVTTMPGLVGTIAVQETVAVVWVNTRYYSHVLAQLDKDTWTVMKNEESPTIKEWLIQTLPKKSMIGIDPTLMTATEFHRYKDAFLANGHQFESVKPNLVDLVWSTNKPKLTIKELEIISTEFSGKASCDKLNEVRAAMKKLRAEIFIVTSLDEIAWLLNLRGSDIEFSSVFFAYMIIMEDNLHLYVLDKNRITDSIENHFITEGLVVNTFEYDDAINGITKVVRPTNGKVLLSEASEAISYLIQPQERRIVKTDSPICELRNIKNAAEVNGMRAANIRDSATVIQYLHWLENEIDVSNVTELKSIDKLKSLKSQQYHYRKLSCPTVSAVGRHAALGRYTPATNSDTQITRDEIYFLTSGTHYLDGTTFISRTVHFGTPSDMQKDAFTRVLKGFISVVTSVFPPNAPHSFFDALARQVLWDVGLDYEHPTGFGIGSYQNRHDIPPKMARDMFITIGPGYYEENHYGIRISDVLHVIDLPESSEFFEGSGALHFEDMSMVPIQTKMININLLSDEEIEWLNAHHNKIRETIRPHLEGPVVDWLIQQTEPIHRNEAST